MTRADLSLPPDAADPSGEMLRARYRLLTRQIPTLYLIVVVCTVPVIGLVLTRGGGWEMALAPALMVAIVFARMIHWRRARAGVETMSVASMQREMRRTGLIGPAIGFILASASIAAGLRLDLHAQAVTLVTVWMCTIACSFCLSTLPRTAYAVVFASGAPLCAVFLYNGEPMLVLAGGLIVALACLVIFVVKQNHDAFAEIVTARSLAEQRQMLAARRGEEAARLANSDCLTRLANRRAFMTALGEGVDGGRRFAVALIDLDGFKPVNDVYGHAAGDALLVEIGGRLAALMDGRGLAARFGGDEFCLMIDDVADAAQALALARLARNAIAAPCALSSQVSVAVDCCVGVALHDGAASAGDLIERADATLYQCKRRGGAVAVWTPAAGAPPQDAASSQAA